MSNITAEEWKRLHELFDRAGVGPGTKVIPCQGAFGSYSDAEPYYGTDAVVIWYKHERGPNSDCIRVKFHDDTELDLLIDEVSLVNNVANPIAVHLRRLARVGKPAV